MTQQECKIAARFQKLVLCLHRVRGHELGRFRGIAPPELAEGLRTHTSGKTFGNGDRRTSKGEMGKGWTIAAKFAGKIDRRRLGALAVLVLESVLLWVVLPYNYGSALRTSTDRNVRAVSTQSPAVNDWLAATPELHKSDRVLYPYSVIPGGVENSGELRNAVAHDATVARHYADFNLSNAHVIRLQEARAVFVSYRVGSRIFWTKNRLNLRAGETVITDGEHIARTRCGNRISELPVGPVLNNEPLPAAMEIPADGALLTAAEFSSELPLALPPATTIILPPQTRGSIFIPPVPPVFPIGGVPPYAGIPPGPLPPPSAPPPSGPPPSLPPPSVPPPPPPISTPEPSDFLMLMAGFVCVWLLRKRARA
jgi:hypothetical protein